MPKTRNGVILENIENLIAALGGRGPDSTVDTESKGGSDA